MGRAKSHGFVDKSIAAALSGIEIYNKPDFKYREETFAILMVNAWELLLKARVLALNKNNLASIYAWEPRPLKDGRRGKRRVVRQNRAGNPLTIGIPRALDILVAAGENLLEGACRENINVLVEIRDNAIHFRHAGPDLGKKVQEIGTASLRNYLVLVRKWFDYDLSRYNFYLMPLSFFHAFEAESFSVSKPSVQLENLIAYIGRQELAHPSNEDNEFNIGLRLETRFVRTASPEAIPFQRTGDPSHITITLSEEDALKRFPLTYEDLTRILRGRYKDFLANAKYHALRKQLAQDPRFCRERLLDPQNPRGLKKEFYNSEVVKEFDKHYVRSR